MKKYIITTISLGDFYIMIILSLVFSFIISIMISALINHFVSFKFIWNLFILFSSIIFFVILNSTKKKYLNKVEILIAKTKNIILIEKDKNIKI